MILLAIENRRAQMPMLGPWRKRRTGGEPTQIECQDDQSTRTVPELDKAEKLGDVGWAFCAILGLGDDPIYPATFSDYSDMDVYDDDWSKLPGLGLFEVLGFRLFLFIRRTGSWVLVRLLIANWPPSADLGVSRGMAVKRNTNAKDSCCGLLMCWFSALFMVVKSLPSSRVPRRISCRSP